MGQLQNLLREKMETKVMAMRAYEIARDPSMGKFVQMFALEAALVYEKRIKYLTTAIRKVRNERVKVGA